MPILNGGWHLLGTARMGGDPTTSVTDARGRLHAVPNILVADGSLFTTVGAVNPGSTIGALALKIASPQISHKSDVDGVRAGVSWASDANDRADLMSLCTRAVTWAYRAVVNPSTTSKPCSIQEVSSSGLTRRSR